MKNGVCGQSTTRTQRQAPQKQTNDPLLQPCFDGCDQAMDGALDCMGFHDYPVGGGNCSCVPVSSGGSWQEMPVDTNDDGITDAYEWFWIPGMNNGYVCHYTGPSIQMCYAQCMSVGGPGMGGVNFQSFGAPSKGWGFKRGGRVKRGRRRR
tara:strand:- start:429 stop:881 length:453 start_codon:yes stop_codon:yes gene_type:complete